MRRTIAGLAFLVTGIGLAAAQDKSVRPGINDPFKDPDVPQFQGKFEVESREVYANRAEIVKRVGLKPGMDLLDLGSGCGEMVMRMALLGDDAVGLRHLRRQRDHRHREGELPPLLRVARAGHRRGDAVEEGTDDADAGAGELGDSLPDSHSPTLLPRRRVRLRGKCLRHRLWGRGRGR